MRNDSRQTGSVLVMTVFIIVLLSTVVAGILNMTSVDIQIMQNQVFAAESVTMAMAGLNDALGQLRLDAGWNDGFTNKAFNNGTYTVEVDNDEITSTGATAQGFIAEVTADLTIGAAGPPYTVRLDALRINE
jgi:hypothetical protein